MSSKSQDIVNGILVSFDIFYKKDIEKVNEKIIQIIEYKPTIEKSAIMGRPQDSES